MGEREDRLRILNLEDRYEKMMDRQVPQFNASHCSKLADTKEEYKCYIKTGMTFSKMLTNLMNKNKPKCKTLKDPVERRSCMYAVNRVFNGNKYDINQVIKQWRSYLKTLSEGVKMKSIKTILLFEVMYRHNILGLPLNEIENQLKNYPTQDAEDLLKHLRGELTQDTIHKEPETEDDVAVVEGQESGDKEAYRNHFNKMLKAKGASNISDLSKEQRKEFFTKIDKHWKSKDEKKVNEEIEWTDDIMEEFVMEFSEFADVFSIIKKEMEKHVLEEASGKRTSMSRITRQTKIDRAVGSLAVQYAKAKNDPLYKKFKKFKDKWMKFKERIQAKYKARVRTAARQGGGISHLLNKDKKEPKKEPKK